MTRKMFCLLGVILVTSSVSGGHLTNDGWDCGDGEQTWGDEAICDGYNQCDDNSDEGTEPGEGCNLYPGSGCPSYRGIRRWRCERTGRCYDTKGEADTCETSDEEPSRDCSVTRIGGQEVPGWRCRDTGRCIERDKVCDGKLDCDDKSDEAMTAWDGCNLFPNYTDWCTSWAGERHVSCPPRVATCIPVTMLASINNSDPASCHACPAPGMWRCDNGQCIDQQLRRDGRPDCVDGSDEARVRIQWHDILISTLVIVIILLLTTFFLKNKAVLKCCFAQGDEVDGFEDSQEDLSLYSDSDIPIDLIGLLDDNKNWEEVEQNQDNKRSEIVLKSLKTTVLPKVKELYLVVKRDTIRYHHLYMYLANRHPTVHELGAVTKQFLKWEMELHGLNKREVLRFWRLHLGNSHQTKLIIRSVEDENKCFQKLQDQIYPIRLILRNFRRQMAQLQPLEDDTFYKISSLLYSAIVPFVEGCFFLAVRLKNIVFINAFYKALVDLSRGEPTEHPFELSLVVAMSISVAVTQLLFILYSIYYSEEIFECGKRASTLKKWLLKFFAAILSPFVPIFILANHIYHDSKLHRNRRLLQTYNDQDVIEERQNDNDKSLDQENRSDPADDGETVSAENDSRVRDRINLYKLCQKEESKSLLFRKLYSYYRVTSAVMESCTVIVCLILLLIVTVRTSMKIHLIEGVEQKLYRFFNIKNSSGVLSELNLMRDVVILGSVLYSMAIILTALVKYWYQAKNLSISVKGQITLALYMLFLSINRVTTFISLFSLVNPSGGLTLTLAIIIFAIIQILRVSLVFVYKCFFNDGQNIWDKCRAGGGADEGGERVPRGWETADIVDKWVNVLVNTLVVIPFIFQRQPLQVLKSIEKKFNVNDSLKRKRSGNGLNPNNHLNYTRKTEENDEFFREQILGIWEADPNTKLDIVTVRKRMLNAQSSRFKLTFMTGAEMDNKIRNTLESLEEAGLVNKPLLNPIPTKREYFWLFMIVILENLIALCVELSVGGFGTTKVN